MPALLMSTSGVPANSSTAALTCSEFVTSHAVHRTPVFCSSSKPATSMSKTVTLHSRATRASTMARPRPFTPPVTMICFPRRSTLNSRSSVTQNTFDIAHAAHRYNLVEAELKTKLSLKFCNQFHVFKGIPHVEIFHRQISRNVCDRYLQQLR